MSTFTALFDACVLYRVSVTDLLMRLAATGLFRARWTSEIHEDWIRSLLRERPDLSRESLERRRDAMNRGAEGCLVRDYESLIDGLDLPDPKDRHVLAAAIRTQAHVIVTYNLTDFPSDALAPYGVEAQHPDLFVCHLLDLAPGNDELLDSFRKASLPEFATKLAEFRDLI